jgi:hypothetical protein
VCVSHGAFGTLATGARGQTRASRGYAMSMRETRGGCWGRRELARMRVCVSHGTFGALATALADTHAHVAATRCRCVRREVGAGAAGNLPACGCVLGTARSGAHDGALAIRSCDGRSRWAFAMGVRNGVRWRLRVRRRRRAQKKGRVPCRHATPRCRCGYFAGAPGIQRFTPLCPEHAPGRTVPSQNMPSVHCAIEPTESALAPVFVGLGAVAGAGV